MSREEEVASTSAIVLRRATDADYSFMRALYGSTRAEEMDRFPFTPEEREAFLDQQFAAQSSHYAEHYPTARFDIIEREGEPIGRFYVDVWPTQIRIVDIALVARCRGKGIGTDLLQRVFDEAAGSGKRVTIHVEAFNPALHLYERLGFKRVDTNGVYLLMEWVPEAQPRTSQAGATT